MAPQQPLEMILVRQLASYLAIPIWIMDAQGNLTFYNEPAEHVLGVRFDDAGPIKAGDLAEMFRVTDIEGNPLPDEEIPVVNALTNRKPDHRTIRFNSMDGAWRIVQVVAMPVEGQGNRFLGVFAAFWELED